MSQGHFVWYELLTSDTNSAGAFYGKVLGWGTQDVPMPGMTYRMFAAEGVTFAGLMTLPEQARQMGAPPHWMGYISVNDVDAATEKVKQLGGRVFMPPHDIPDVGRFSVVADPQSAAFALFRWNQADGSTQPTSPGARHVGWCELLTTNWKEAFAFYHELFGWEMDHAFDMGDMGTYQVFRIGDQQAGGMFNKPPGIPAPFWLFYFTVDDIDAAASRVTEFGGSLMREPVQVPGGGWIVQAKDPQGAGFALVGNRR